MLTPFGRRTVLLVVVSALLAAAAGASELEPAPLVVVATADSVVVSGGHFALTWSAARGGDLTSIRIHDGVAWHELIAPGMRRISVPGILVYTPQGPYGPFGRGTLTVGDQEPGSVVVTSEMLLVDEKEGSGPLTLRTTYTVYAEGAVFLDLDLTLAAKAKKLTVTRASVGFPVDVTDYTLQFWHWQQSLDRGSGMLEPQPTFTSVYCPNVGLALGTAGTFSNQLQVILESPDSFAGSAAPVVTYIAQGRSFATWLLPENAGPLELTPPFCYTNRWGFLLTRRPQRSRLTGHRLAHWIEEEGDGMVYPSASAIDAMARAGATGLVLGPGWRARGGRDGNIPVDEADFRRLIADAKAAGLICLATVYPEGPDGDGEALGLWARDHGLAGLLIAQASTHYQTFARGRSGYPARASFEWMRALRRGLGPTGIIIVHPGLEVPDLTFGLLADGVAFGRERADWRAARSTLSNEYLGGAAYAVPCPLATDVPMQTNLAVAIAAATGSVPLVPAGYGASRSIYAARYALPLWQLMRLVGPGPGVEVRAAGIGAVSASSNVNFWSIVYRMSDDEALLVTSNLSPADQDSSAIWIDFPALGFSGEYDVEYLRADSMEEFTVRHLGSTTSGRLRTDPVVRHGVRGYLFVRGEMPARTAQGLDQGLKTASVFFDRQAPEPVTGLVAAPVTGGLSLSWDPAADNQHVVNYRIYRSADPAFKRAADIGHIGDSYEETRYVDLGVSPGDSWSYAVSAVDVNGNEGLPSAAATGIAPSGTTSLSFADSTSAARFLVLSGAWRVHDSAYGFGCAVDATALARTLVEGIALADLDVAVTIDGVGGSPYGGGLFIRADERGNGIALVLTGGKHNEIVLGRVEGETLIPLATAYFPYLRPLRSMHTLRLVARQSSVIGYADDRELVRAELSGDTGARIGLIALRGHVHFDNLTVSPAAAGGP